MQVWFFGKKDLKELGFLKIVLTNKMFVVCFCLSQRKSYCDSFHRVLILLFVLYTYSSNLFFALFITNSIYESFPFFPTRDNTNYSIHFKTLKDFSICYLNVFMQISVHFYHPLVPYASYALPLFTIILEKFLISKASHFCLLLCKCTRICRKPFNL